MLMMRRLYKKIKLFSFISFIAAFCSFYTTNVYADNNDPLTLVLKARQANANFDYRSANDFYKAAKATKNVSAEVLEEYLAFAISQQNLPLAVKLAQEVILQDPQHSLAHTVIAINYLNSGELDAAIKYLEQQNSTSDSYNGILLTALHGIKLFKQNNEKVFFDQETELQKSSPYLYLYLISSYHTMLEKYDLAMKDFSALNDISPNVDTLLDQQAIYYKLNGNVNKSFNDYLGDNFLTYKQSEKYLQEFKKPNQKDVISNLLVKLATMKEDNTSSVLLISDGFILSNLALILSSDNDLAKLYIAKFYISIGNYKGAIANYKSINKDSYYFRIAATSVTDLLTTLKLDNEAIEFLQDAVTKDKDNPKLFLEMGDIYHKNGNSKKAIIAYTQALHISEDNNFTLGKWLAYYFRGIAYNVSGNWPLAEQDLLLAQKINPNDPLLVNYLAYSWIEHDKNIKLALEMLEKALQIDPENPNILDSYALGLFKNKQYTKALNYATKANSIDPYNATIANNLADILWKVNKKDKAIYYWNMAFNINHDQNIQEKINGKLPNYLQ